MSPLVSAISARRQIALSSCGFSQNGGAILLLRFFLHGRVFGRVQQLCQLKMHAGQMRINRNRLAILRDRPVRVPFSRFFMRQQLMHLRGVRRHQRQAQHRLAGKIGISSVSRIQYFGRVRIRRLQLTYQSRRFVQLTVRRVQPNQVQPTSILSFRSSIIGNAASKIFARIGDVRCVLFGQSE